MGFDLIGEVMRAAERVAVEAGVPAAEASAILIRAEAELVASKIASDRSERQFLLRLKEQGASQMARDLGCSRRSIYNRRARAVNKVCRKRIGNLHTPA